MKICYYSHANKQQSNQIQGTVTRKIEDLTNTNANPGNILAVLGIVSEYDNIVFSTAGRGWYG